MPDDVSCQESVAAFRSFMKAAAEDIKAGGEIQAARVIYPKKASAFEIVQLKILRKLAARGWRKTA